MKQPRHFGRIKKKAPRKLTTLVFLMFFVLAIILVSVAVASGISFWLFRMGLLPPIHGNRFPIILAVILLASLFMGSVLTLIGGSYCLRPLRTLIAATKQVAAGNFKVRVVESGPDELKRLTASFNEMIKDLSSIETLRQDFVSNISHEFKTPVVSIRGFARLLKKDNLSEETRQEYLDIIISESERLTQLSSNVLLLSNLESTDHMVEEARFSLDEQIRRTILLFEPQIGQKNLKLDIDLDEVQIICNEEMLQHVWINLIANAIKFTEPGGSIRLALHVQEDKACVTVEDSGIGMSQEVKGHLFEKFYQGDASRSTEGNGLGLSLVKRILELCNGSATVESEPGEGTSFSVVFPLPTEEQIC